MDSKSDRLNDYMFDSLMALIKEINKPIAKPTQEEEQS